MIKKYFLSSMLLLAAVMLSGCTTEHKTDDIDSYVKKELALEDYTISKEYEESEGEDGYTDRIWTVVDEKNDITFHVMDNYYWGAESLTNSLDDDYEATVFLQYLDQLPTNEPEEEGRITITAGADAQGINEVSIAALYADRTELQNVLDQLTAYREFFQELGFDVVNPGIQLQYEGPDDYPCKGHMIGGDTWTVLNSDMENVFKEALGEYILTGLDYRLEEVLSDTTAGEQQEMILAENTNRVGIVRENDQTEYYDDLIGNCYGYGLSVSTLYQVLEREGLEPDGDALHFTCAGSDGTEYEFSCGFVTEDFDGEEGAYYLADGEPVKLGNAYNIHINATEASKLFGITITVDWNKEITGK